MHESTSIAVNADDFSGRFAECDSQCDGTRLSHPSNRIEVAIRGLIVLNSGVLNFAGDQSRGGDDCVMTSDLF